MRTAEALAKYMQLLRDIKEEFPDFDVRYKSDSRTMKVLDILLKVVTFGRMKTFMTEFITTYGSDIYVPDGWGDRDPLTRCITLRHERVHLRQKQRYFRSIKWLSSLWFSAQYTLWILPAGLAMGRKLIEQEAYEESLRARAEYLGIAAIDDANYRKSVVHHFISADYFWTWPYRASVEKWYDATVHKIRIDMRDA
jgi:hypothetical protein